MKLKRRFFEKFRYGGFIFLTSLLIATLVFLGFFSQELRSQKRILQSNEIQKIKLLQKAIENDIKVNAYNLIFLANHSKLHKWLTHKKTEHRLELAHLFQNFCDNARLYDQIRFIDQHGMEHIRINYNDGHSTSISKSMLQNKAHRYYFKETINLSLSQIFISPFDLNVEQGKIEKPIKPMIRFGMPVYDFGGQKVGIVLLNYLGAKLINNLDTLSRSSVGKTMLLNADGFWLKALQPEDEWGFMFQHGQAEKMPVKNPLEWAKIIKQNEGQFNTDKGLYSFGTIRFTDLGMFSATGSEQAFNPYKIGQANEQFYWKVVSFVSARTLNKLSMTILSGFLPFYVLVVMVLFAISWWLGFTMNQRIRTQKALDQNQAEIRSVFRSVPAGIGMVSNRVIKQANTQLCRMSGYSKKELMGKNARLLYPTNEDFEYVGREKYTQIKKKGTGSVETRWRRKNGEIIDVLLSSTPVNLNDLSAGVTFSAFDITARKKAEEQLAASEERYRIIIESASDGIFTISKDCTFTSLNTALEELIGQKRDIWIGKTCMDLISPEDREAAEQVFAQALNGKSSIVHEFRINTDTQGKYKICEFKIKPKYDQNKRLIGTVGFIKDMTEYNHARERVQRAETQLRHSQKMEAIGTLAGGIAHDFNNILSGIFGYAQLAEMNMDGSGKSKHYIAQVVKGAQRASALVQQILTFSRQTEYEKQPLMISITIKEALKLLRASIPSTIEIKDTVFSKAKVMADPTQIHQVIMNLCTNAYHAMRDKGGVLEVGLQEIEISDQDSIPELNKFVGKYLKLEVSDTGCGIDKGVIERVFDPYFTTKKVGEGTGLGLALVQAIVNDHGGFLEVDTELNKGTWFNIYLPVIEKTVELEPILKKTLPLKGYENILFVDDEESIRSFSKDYMEDYGYHVHTFENGLDAFNAFEKSPDHFDLVITDMTMPGMTGDKLAAKMIEQRPDLPVILCTGYSEKISEEDAFELGISKFVQKPIANQDLLILVREILDLK